MGEALNRRWTGSRALGLHALLVLFGPGCLIAGWWQLHQALAGNTLSWAYTFEWPCFAVIATVAWWHLIHEDPIQRQIRLDHRSPWRNLRRRNCAGGWTWPPGSSTSGI